MSQEINFLADTKAVARFQLTEKYWFRMRLASKFGFVAFLSIESTKVCFPITKLSFAVSELDFVTLKLSFAVAELDFIEAKLSFAVNELDFAIAKLNSQTTAFDSTKLKLSFRCILSRNTILRSTSCSVLGLYCCRYND